MHAPVASIKTLVYRCNHRLFSTARPVARYSLRNGGPALTRGKLSVVPARRENQKQLRCWQAGEADEALTVLWCGEADEARAGLLCGETGEADGE